MNEKEFQKFLNRDGGCVHCGAVTGVVPHHRLNRGMGGSKERDVPSNIVALCSMMNGLIESDADWADQARRAGWKLRNGDSPRAVPIFYAFDNAWYLLDDGFRKFQVPKPDSI